MAAFCSFPQVMGHEVVADVVVGAEGPRSRGGPAAGAQPVAVLRAAWIEPTCPACENGDYSLCWNFSDGDIKPGIHTGVSGRCHRWLRRADAGPRQHVLPSARFGARRVGGLRRPVLRVAPRHHPASAAAPAPGPGLRRRLVGVVRASRSCGPSIPTWRSRWWPASKPRPSWPADSARPSCWRMSHGWPSSRSWRPGPAAAMQPMEGLPMAYPGASTSSTTPSASRRPSRSASGS